mmetsp:Transcript_12517/g.18903  ORF Transcript_12517/g.18903 Transcript_12517/m.18903 type:complete len:770 (+) Transcript_12517:107-2416(+)
MTRIASLVFSSVVGFIATVSSETLPDAYNPYTLCSGVVDYDFFVPEGSSADELNALAISMMSPSWAFLGADCKSDMKRLVCAVVYQPTVSTESDDELPYQRPCRSLCDSTTYLGSSCAGWMENLGTAMNCSSELFDSSNDPDQCNAMAYTENTLLVAESAEPYIGSICQGVTDDIATPSPSSIDPNLPPYLPPYVAQSMVEYGAIEWISNFPLMTKDDCQTDFRKMACGLMYPAPQESFALSFLFGPLVFPSFPHLSICTTFLDTCADFLDIVPEFGMDCSATAGNLALFPNDTQTIATVDLGWGPVLLETDPNYMMNTTFQGKTECPYAFVVPDDPNGNRVQWLHGFGCVSSCPFRAFTYEESDMLYNFLITTQWFSLVTLSLALYNLYFLTSPNKRNPFLVAILWAMWPTTVLFCLILTGRKDFEIVCKDNNQSRSIEDAGDTPLDFSCAFSAIYFAFYDNFIYFMFFAMASELWCRVILEAKSVKKYRYIYVYGFGAVMLFLTLFQILYPQSADMVGRTNFQLYCSWDSQSIVELFNVRNIPSVIIYSVATILTAAVVFTTIKVSLAVSGSFSKLWKSYRTMFIGVFLFVGVLPVLIFVMRPIYFIEKRVENNESAIEWITCLLTHFRTESDDSYLETCGHHPEKRFPIAMFVALFVTYYIVAPIGNLWASNGTEAGKVWKRRLEPYYKYFACVIMVLRPFVKCFRMVTPEVNSARTKIIPVDSTPKHDQTAPPTGRDTPSDNYKPLEGSESNSEKQVNANGVELV